MHRGFGPDAVSTAANPPLMHWQTARFLIDLSRPRVMGIVNVTPDSFSDGGAQAKVSAALAHCERLVADGADILDVGGESTRPGASPVPVEEELRRVLPVVRGAVSLGVAVSVDTSAVEVMRQSLDLGADIVNDVRALRRPGALSLLASHPRAGVCLMHMKGEPETMREEAVYTDVVAEVGAFLRQRALEVQAAGIAPERIAIDPGIGFAKTARHNLALLARQAELANIGWPLLVGWSRKATLGRLTGRPVGERLPASLSAMLVSVQMGARIVRVHDVAATVDALTVWRAAHGLAEFDL
jgi:dihydropteroate synthase